MRTFTLAAAAVALALPTWALPQPAELDTRQAPPHWDLDIFTSVTCNGDPFFSQGGVSAINCTGISGNGTTGEAYSWSGGGRFGAALYSGADCSGSVKSVTSDTDCDNAGFAIVSFLVRGAV